MRTRGREFDCMRTPATEYLTACRAVMQLHGVSYQPYSNGSACFKRTIQVASRLLSVAPWSVEWSPCIS